MIKKYLFLFCIFSLACFITFNEWPSVRSKMVGQVKDSAGNPLEKVKVTFISLRAASQKFEITTNKEGKFTQVGLWPGYYQVSFKKSGFML